MKISVVTITYNSREFLEETIASVLVQGYPELEYLIVDGGSTDGTLDIVNRYAVMHPWIKWISEPDRGIADAMNKGIRLATGDVVAHLHADDAYLDGTLAEVCRAFAANPGARWATGRIRCVNTAGERLYDTELKRSYNLSDILYGNIISHPATFVRRSVFDEVGLFDPELRYSMDYDLWLRIAALEPPILIDKVLAKFRVHPNSLSSANILAAMAEEHAIRQRNWGVLSSRARLAAELRYHRETMLIRLGLNNFRKRFMQRLTGVLQSSDQ
ncbi:putative glycosyltransferase Rv1514c [Geobacter sp. OR-1]|uniref:glycosyltransferase family 2 protein n=1 Tax=Geobacter sp. OR-1 TaxID=1266765 RepID=UPI0005426228|nr:glycosyltransferase family 2 protein [Geobacter sp. OR-1]GAM11004.1 putative glycosyltransferase Rv1514c [Geobacter sp. OR-1]